jgi:NAD(P)H-hydrate repair Nnr-like enzyme with NAD(P)H-hydrate dehydratase domain/NAD(P)H-hydrate repair Nnr-like enzyme with NAD(P)H-hydrate epimerase domain
VIEAWSTRAVYAAEALLMETLEDGALMARAVEGLAGVAAARLEERHGTAVAALVGPGNNGADALFAVARLAEAGWNAVAVHHEPVHEDARAAAVAAGVVLTTDPSVLREADVVLDGILGIGARPGLPQWASEWLAAVPESAHLVAVDLPSGQDPMGGAIDPEGVFADETVTFSVAKPVHLLPPTEQACGLLTVVDIGIRPTGEPVVRRLDHDDVAQRWPRPTASDDKYSRGVLGVVAGGESYPGAAVLTVTAAVEAGVGMVRYVGTPTPTHLVAVAVPEAVHDPGRVQAWVVGPGLDAGAQGEQAHAQLEVALEALRGLEPVVVDADGLDLLDDALLNARRDAVTLLTPHAGECARLLTRLGRRAGVATASGLDRAESGDEVPAETASEITREDTREVTRDQVEAAPLRHARALAGLTGATVLLKGSTTLVVGPGEQATAFSQADAPAWLATAGAGDVLAGVAGTLLAAGLPADEAAALAALVHGVAADRANPGGPVRALAVAHGIPTAVAHLLGRGTAS